MAAPELAPKGDMSALILRLKHGPRPVSALSAFLRTLQAAVRETAASNPAGAALLDQRPGPTLSADIGSDGESTTFSLQFSDSSGAPMDSLSHDSFLRFMQELAATLSAQPQRDLWGSPVVTHRTSPDDRERVREVLEELSRLGNASLEYGRRKIELTEGAGWLGEN